MSTTAPTLAPAPQVSGPPVNVLFDDESTIPSYYFTHPDALSPLPADAPPLPAVNPPLPAVVPPLPAAPAAAYDSDDEADVPLTASDSIKRSCNKYPSLVIPSPSAWPSIDKLKSAMGSASVSSLHLLPTPQTLLHDMAARRRPGGRCTTPSLDGSQSSDELERHSCPSTPEVVRQPNATIPTPTSPACPVQLDPQALETLRHLHRPVSAAFTGDKLWTPPPPPAPEMQEIHRDRLVLSPPEPEPSEPGSEPLSAISIPSPGGFFSSLNASARHTWGLPHRDPPPTTSTAEKFYGVPWARSTAPVPKSVRERVHHHADYHARLQELGSSNLDRMGDWLREQDELLMTLRTKANTSASSSASTGTISSANIGISSSASTGTTASHSHNCKPSLNQSTNRKTVRFDLADEPTLEPKANKSTMYLEAWTYLRERAVAADAFVHGQARVEAMHVQRRCLPAAHRDLLLGKFELSHPVRPVPPRPVSDFCTNDSTALKDRIACALMERQALDQMRPATWVLHALKLLNGGHLLGREAAAAVARQRQPRLLDLGGVPANDWAWEVALDHPRLSVTTVYTANKHLTTDVAGPSNHCAKMVPNLWTLPYPRAHFDVVSARSLFQHLKKHTPAGSARDEYDLCLHECLRVLKPGGLLEFSLLDAEVLHPSPLAQALGVEFAFNLRTRGYDAAATHSFVPRLHATGFARVRRAWLALPMGGGPRKARNPVHVGAAAAAPSPDLWGSADEAAALASLVGAWAWERWMLHLQLEMGRPDARLLDGVGPMLDEAASSGAAWRFLTGCARKPGPS